MLNRALSLDRPNGELVFKSPAKHCFAELNVKLWFDDLECVFWTVVLLLRLTFLLLELALFETLVFQELFKRHRLLLLITHRYYFLYVELHLKIKCLINVEINKGGMLRRNTQTTQVEPDHHQPNLRMPVDTLNTHIALV